MTQPAAMPTTVNQPASAASTSLATDLQPVQWPELPPARPYPQTLEQFLEMYGQRLLPSPADQEAARQSGREGIWNFFFQIDPEDIRQLQKEEREMLNAQRQRCDALYDDRHARLRAGLAKIADRRQRPTNATADDTQYTERAIELEDLIRAKALHFNPHGRNILLVALGLALAITVLGVVQRPATSAPLSAGSIIGAFITWAIIACIFGGITYMILNQIRTNKEQGELSAIKTHLRQNERDTRDEPRISAAITQLQDAYTRKCTEIDQRLTAMQQGLEPILQKLPKPPDGSVVIQQLRDDMLKHKERYIKELGVGTRLQTIVRDLDEAVVPNPLPFISPGSLQDPMRIPLPYRPPQRATILEQLGTLGRRAQNVDDLRELATQWRNAPTAVRGLVSTVTRTPGQEAPKAEAGMSDRVRHMLARRMAASDGQTHLLHGVYYIEYMFIADSMLIHHGFFYDFILDKTTADRTTELFFQDIVAIEKSLEYREIPRRLDTDEPLIIEDAPTISITLPSGDQRTFTFANRAYLDAVVSDILVERGLNEPAGQRVELDPSQEVRLDADGAMRFMSHMLREHKYLRT